MAPRARKKRIDRSTTPARGLRKRTPSGWARQNRNVFGRIAYESARHRAARELHGCRSPTAAGGSYCFGQIPTNPSLGTLPTGGASPHIPRSSRMDQRATMPAVFIEPCHRIVGSMGIRPPANRNAMPEARKKKRSRVGLAR